MFPHISVDRISAAMILTIWQKLVLAFNSNDSTTFAISISKKKIEILLTHFDILETSFVFFPLVLFDAHFCTSLMEMNRIWYQIITFYSVCGQEEAFFINDPRTTSLSPHRYIYVWWAPRDSDGRSWYCCFWSVIIHLAIVLLPGAPFINRN